MPDTKQEEPQDYIKPDLGCPKCFGDANPARPCEVCGGGHKKSKKKKKKKKKKEEE